MGRPPQEDTSFGALIHELTGPIIPSVIPGVRAVHAVDAAGVHPLLLALASERYVPDSAVRRPQEILTIANAILGQGQLSLAKYLLIVAREDDPDLDIHNIPAFLFAPLSVLRKAPAALPTQMTAGSDGATTTVAMRPPVGPEELQPAKVIVARRERVRAVTGVFTARAPTLRARRR